MLGYTLRLYGLLMDEELPGNAAGYWARLIARPAFKVGEVGDIRLQFISRASQRGHAGRRIVTGGVNLATGFQIPVIADLALQ